MNIKHLSTLLLLSMTLLLAACIDEVSRDNETVYGTIALSDGKVGEENSAADTLIRRVIDFQVDDKAKVIFQTGYTVIGGESSKGDQGTLYAAEYKLTYEPAFTTNDQWAEQLQKTLLETSWEQVDLSNTLHDATYYKIPEEEFSFDTHNTSLIYAAVKVEYVKQYGTYWVYVAIPSSKIGAADDPEIISRFNELRKEQ